MNKHEKRAYEAGVRAEEMGELLSACPFTEPTTLRTAWRAGHGASLTARKVPGGLVAKLHKNRNTRRFK